MKTHISEIFSALLDLFFPHLCHVCNKHQPAGDQLLCVNCLSGLSLTDYNSVEDNPFIQHFYGRLPVLSGACLYHFTKTGTVRQLLHAIKYNNRTEVGVQEGRRLGRFLMDSASWENVDYIIPVPLHPKKQRLRGYNQCKVITDGMAEEMHIPVYPLIKRVKFSTSQTKKGRAGRIEALDGVFMPDFKAISLFLEQTKKENPHFLLVDDVLTTGATLEACSLALLKAFPDARLSLATLAMGRM